MMPSSTNSRWRRPVAALLLSFALVHVVLTWSVRDRILTGFPDYTIFYTAGTILHRGLAPRLYDASLQYEIQREFVLAIAKGRGLLPYNHPPYEAVLFIPFSHLPYLTGYLLWAALNALIFFWACWLLKPHLPHLPKFHWAVPALLAISFFPVFATLFEGQDSNLVLLLYVLSFIDLKKGRPVRAGMWLALALFKFQIVVPFIAFAFLARRWRLVAGFAASALLLAVANIALIGWREALYYPVFVRHLEKTTAGGAIVGVTMPNLHGLVDAISAHATGPRISFAITAVLSLLIIVVAGMASDEEKTPSEGRNLCFSLGIVVAVLVSYHCFFYDWTILLLSALLSFDYLAALPKIATLPQRLMLMSASALFLSPLYLVPLVRFGHLYGLSLLLLIWSGALFAEINALRRRSRSVTDPQGSPNSSAAVSQLKPAVPAST